MTPPERPRPRRPRRRRPGGVDPGPRPLAESLDDVLDALVPPRARGPAPPAPPGAPAAPGAPAVPGAPGPSGAPGPPDEPAPSGAPAAPGERRGPGGPTSPGGNRATARPSGSAATWGTIFSRWEELVGPALARHARPLRLEDGALVVAVDRPPWATQVKALGGDILARLREETGEPLERLVVVVRP